MAFPQTILPLCTELLVGTTWTDITSQVYSRQPIQITRGRADESQQVEPANMQLTLDNRDGRFSPRNPVGAYYGNIGRNTQIRQSVVGASYLQIKQPTGVTSGTAYVSTPDAAALDITGDLDIRFDADLTTWSENMELVSKWTETGNQRSYLFGLANGTLYLWRSTDGSAVGSAVATVPLPTNHGRQAVRAVLQVNTPAGSRTTTFYTAPTLAGPWTQLGSSLVASPNITLFSGSGIVAVLDNPNSSSQASVIRGKIYGAQIYNGVAGTLVANPDFTAQTHGATSFVDSTGKTWTVNGGLELSTHNMRFYGEVPSWPNAWDQTGVDATAGITAAGILRRLGAGGAPPLTSTMRKTIPSTPNLVGYWPFEDEAGAISAASGLAGGSPMQVTNGTASFASETGFACSAPCAVANSAYYSGNLARHTATGFYSMRIIAHIPAGGMTTSGGVMMTLFFDTGIVSRAELVYHTGGGDFEIRLWDKAEAGTLLFSSGNIDFNSNGFFMLLSMEFTNSGSNLNYKIGTLKVGATAAGVFTGTFNSVNLGHASRAVIDATSNVDSMGFGHCMVATSLTDVFAFQPALDSFLGETAGRRIERLCREAGINFEGSGDLDDSTPMGSQSPQALLTLIQEAVDADLGILYEPRDWLALGYLPRSALYQQAPDITLDYPSHQMDSLVPVEDDQHIQNDVTVTRTNGSSARAVDTTSIMSTQQPPAGVGVYATSATVNVRLDTQAADQAGWRLLLGTLAEARFPTIALNLANKSIAGDATLTRQAQALDAGSRIAITNPPPQMPPDDISQLVQGVQETLAQYQWDMTLNCSPHSPYDSVGRYDDGASRYMSDGSTLNTGVNSTATSLSIATPSGPLWTHADGNYDILLGGERMTVTNVTGSSSPQTFTVTRSVNGVVKSQSAGAVLALAEPTYYAL